MRLLSLLSALLVSRQRRASKRTQLRLLQPRPVSIATTSSARSRTKRSIHRERHDVCLMMSTTISFDGVLLARVLPASVLPEQLHQVARHNGQIHEQPNMAAALSAAQAQSIRDEIMASTTTTTTTTTGTHAHDARRPQYVTLELQLRDHPHVHMHLHRAADEPLNQTLARLQISLHKKLSGKNKRGGNAKAALALPRLLYAADNSGATSVVELERTWLEQPNRNVWLHALTTPLVLHLPDAGGGLTLAVHSCPPTLLNVATFANPHVFVEVPLVIQYQVLFGRDVRADWYVNEERQPQAVSSEDDGAFSHRVMTAHNGGHGSACFVPRADHVGKTISVTVTPLGYHDDAEEDAAAQAATYQWERCVEPRPVHDIVALRQDWLATHRPRQHEYQHDNDDDRIFRILTYNILADQNLSNNDTIAWMYPYVTDGVLDRGRRSPLIGHELIQYRADLMCLQEVDQYVFDQWLCPVLAHYGCSGVYAVKAGNGVREGGAVFWNNNVFEVQEQHRHVVADLFPTAGDNDDDDNAAWSDLRTIANLFDRHANLGDTVRHVLGQIVQMVRLRHRATGRFVWAVSTHLYFHPRAPHIRLLQAYVICRQLAHHLRPGDEIVLCGDLNSNLENNAGKLLIDRHVPRNHRTLRQSLNEFVYKTHDDDDRKHDNTVADTNRNNGDDFPSISLPDSFPHLQQGLEATPHVTHCVKGFVGALDHILVTKGSSSGQQLGLTTVASAPMPSLELLQQHTAMPSATLPSDHVSLVCDVKIL